MSEQNKNLTGVRCGDCNFTHPTGVSICPNCGTGKITTFDYTGKGKIYTFTVSTFVPAGPHKARAPYVIAVVETEEGMRLSTIVDVADPEKVKIGDSVVFKGYEENVGPVFNAAT